MQFSMSVELILHRCHITDISTIRSAPLSSSRRQTAAKLCQRAVQQTTFAHHEQRYDQVLTVRKSHQVELLKQWILYADIAQYLTIFDYNAAFSATSSALRVYSFNRCCLGRRNDSRHPNIIHMQHFRIKEIESKQTADSGMLWEDGSSSNMPYG